MIEHDDHARDDQKGLWHVQHVGLGDLDRLDILDHVIADIAEGPGGHWWQVFVGAGAGIAGKGFQGCDRLGIERRRVREVSIAGRLGLAIEDTEPAIRLQPDEGIAPEAFAAGNRLEEEAAGRFRAELQHRGNRGLDVPDAPPDDQFRVAHWSVVMVAL